MENNNYMILKGEQDYEQLNKRYDYIFIDCKLTSDLYFRLRRHNLRSNIYQNLLTNNQFQTLQLEREQILFSKVNTLQLILEHYRYINLEYNYLNPYLNPYWKSDKETIVEKLAKSKIDRKLLREKEAKVSVIEYNIGTSDMLERDCMEIFKSINASQIAYTLNLHRMYKCSSGLMPGEELISKSNVKADNRYFLIPKLNGYEVEKQIFFLNIANYKFFLNNCIGNDYIVHLTEELKDNKFVLNLLANNGIKLLTSYVDSPQKYIKQDIESLALINLVYKYKQAKLVTAVDNTLIEKKIAVGDLTFKRFCLNYKNEIANLSTNSISTSLLKIQ